MRLGFPEFLVLFRAKTSTAIRSSSTMEIAHAISESAGSPRGLREFRPWLRGHSLFRDVHVSGGSGRLCGLLTF